MQLFFYRTGLSVSQGGGGCPLAFNTWESMPIFGVCNLTLKRFGSVNNNIGKTLTFLVHKSEKKRIMQFSAIHYSALFNKFYSTYVVDFRQEKVQYLGSPTYQALDLEVSR